MYFKNIILWVFSTIMALSVAIGFVFIILQIVDWHYISRHPIALVEEDLGYGLIMVFWLILSLILAIPVAGFSLVKFKRIISKKLFPTI